MGHDMSETTPLTTIGIVGTDGVVPQYDPQGRWCWWSKDEIYLGGPAQNKHVPKIKDYVVDVDNYITYIVRHIDPVTLIPDLQEKRPANLSYVVDEKDVLIGVGPGTTADTYRVYLDTSVTPHTLAVDARLKVHGSMTKYCKIFFGPDLSDTGDVITRVYDGSGVYIGNTVNLEKVRFDSHDVHAIQCVPVCYTLRTMDDGEIVTAVFYDDAGHVVSKRQLLVENTSFIRQAYEGEKYITGITMRSPFMSVTYPNLIEFPLNVPLNSLNLIGVVHYNDGSTLELPVDGSKFKIFGLDQYLSSIVGQQIDLVLSYMLSDSESVYGAVTSDGKYITQPFSLVTIQPNNAYTVKVFGYPEYLNGSEGYRMRWWMLNLDRSICEDVTPYVRFNDNTGMFDPTGYGYMQRRSISLKLSDVSGAYREFVHTQVVDILLRGSPWNFATPWEIASESVSERPLYGYELKAQLDAIDISKFTIHSGSTDFEDWLKRVYYDTYPLVNPFTELKPVVPNVIEISYLSWTVRFDISEWNQVLTLGRHLDLNKNIYIKFIRNDGNNDTILSIAGMVVNN